MDSNLFQEVQQTTELLNRLLGDRTLLHELPENERRALLMAAGRLSRPERLEIMKLAKLHRRKQKRKLRAADRELKKNTEIRRARARTVYSAPLRIEPSEEFKQQAALQQARSCYICKDPFTILHSFYDALCPSCAELNYEKRFQSADLRGRTSLITGARLKIGYQAALMLLRAGSQVIVTTRFPRDAAIRFSCEKDFPEWQNRLQVFGLDLRHSPSVEQFCLQLGNSIERLDFLINNAAQTVRRPPGFYSHMMEKELAPFATLPEAVQKLLQSHELLLNQIGSTAKAIPSANTQPGGWLTRWQEQIQGSAIGLRHSASLSQIPYQIDDCQNESDLFPEGKLDADLQQVDLRAKNSWRLHLAEVSTPELLEIQLVNAVAPFILCAKLKPIMLRHKTGDKHVVNVSAMEGKFTRFTKTDKHPHTNMAKAALNMMTLTSAPEFAADGIFMNAVDTGWVTDEDPHLLSVRKQLEHDFEPPLDIVDGAARVLDPIFHGLNSGDHLWGKFLKDYRPTTW